MTARHITVYADAAAPAVTWSTLSNHLEGRKFHSDMPLVVATGNGDVPFLPVRALAFDQDGRLVMEL